jgi:isovaleryl-CoA dehydrogenase
MSNQNADRLSVAQIFSGLSNDEQEILDNADRFAQAEMYPLSQKMDDEEWWPKDIFPKIGATGYFGITAPEQYGGAGMDVFTSGLILQAFGRWNHALALSWVAHENLCLHNILRNANEAQKKKYLPGLCKGTLIGALGLTEPGAGSDALGSMRTTARREGGHYILNGRKMYITNGPVADVLLVYAKTDKENLVGVEDRGVKVVMSGLDLERAMISPICLGIAERALQLAIDYAKQRKQFGRPIADFQMVQSMIAEMYVWVESMRLYTYQTLRAANLIGEDEGGRGDIHKITAAGVMYVSETMNKVLNHGVQVHGGTGYIWESEINRLYRSIKLLEIGAGTTEVRKMIIAGELLRG